MRGEVRPPHPYTTFLLATILLLPCCTANRRQVLSHATEVMRTISEAMEGLVLGASIHTEDAAEGSEESPLHSALLGSLGVPPEQKKKRRPSEAPLHRWDTVERKALRQHRAPDSTQQRATSRVARKARTLQDEERESEFSENEPWRNVKLPFCYGGLKVWPDSLFACTEVQGTFVTSADMGKLSDAERESCRWNRDITDPLCLCPLDAKFDGHLCVSSEVFCDMRQLQPSREGCEPVVYSTDWLKPCHWSTTQGSMDISVQMNCTVPRTPVEEVITDYPLDRSYPIEIKGNSTIGYGTLPEAQHTRFEYKSLADGMNISASHWIQEEHHSFSIKVYNFNRVADDKYRKDWSVTDLGPQVLSGKQSLNHTIRFSDVPSRYYHGGRLYVEIGFLFSPDHVLKVLFDFTDYKPGGRTATGEEGYIAGTVLLSVAIGVVIIVAALLWNADKKAKRAIEDLRDAHE